MGLHIQDCHDAAEVLPRPCLYSSQYLNKACLSAAFWALTIMVNIYHVYWLTI